MNRIAIFGGTFNPIHNGHLHIAQQFQKQLRAQRVLFIPTFVPPHKRAPDLAPAEDRLEMCRLACEGTPFEVSDLEIRRGGPSYTAETLLALKREYPDAELFLIVGSDMLATFDEWYRYHDILMMCTLCAASRKHGFVPELEGKFTQEELEKIKFIEIPVFEVSSTIIRRRISEKESTQGLLADGVRDYIEKKGLYT